MRARLYVIPGSSPSMAARLMLERKGIDYKRRDLISPLHKRVLKMAGFAGETVPALKLDGERIQGSRVISRALEERVPEPPLFPTDPERRAKVEEAERWGDEELQSPGRRLAWWALSKDGSGVRSFLEGSRTGLPPSIGARTSGPFVRASARGHAADDSRAEADTRALPTLLDHVDRLIADGVIGGAEPNAADYQIAPSVRLLMAFEDLRPSIEARPAGEHALRVVPQYPGRIAAGVLPAQWLSGAGARGATAGSPSGTA